MRSQAAQHASGAQYFTCSRKLIPSPSLLPLFLRALCFMLPAQAQTSSYHRIYAFGERAERVKTLTKG
jgi:hypothetical protein